MKTATLKGFGALAAMAALAVPAFAQQPATPAPAAPASAVKHEGHKGQMQKIVKELGLDAKQVDQIKAIMKETRSKAKAINSNTTLNPAEKKVQLKALHEDAHKQIEALLTPEQKQKFDAMTKHHGRKGGKHGDTSAPAAPTPEAKP